MADGDPNELRLVRAFVNTLDVEEGTDQLDELAGLAAWLAEHDLRISPAQDDLAIARQARDALRDLLHANAHGEQAPDALVALNELASTCGVTVHFSSPDTATVRSVAEGVDGVVGRLLADVAGAMAAGTWTRLKLCNNDGCAWAFYDNSRNRSARWCSMAVCGNRSKVASYRDRQDASG